MRTFKGRPLEAFERGPPESEGLCPTKAPLGLSCPISVKQPKGPNFVKRERLYTPKALLGKLKGPRAPNPTIGGQNWGGGLPKNCEMRSLALRCKDPHFCEKEKSLQKKILKEVEKRGIGEGKNWAKERKGVPKVNFPKNYLKGVKPGPTNEKKLAD